MPVLGPLDAITFDFWDTIMVARVDEARRRRVAAVAGVVERTGHPVDAVAVEAAVRAGFQAYQRAWRENRQFGVEDVAEVGLDALGLPESLRPDLVEAIVADGARRELEPAPNVAVTLHALKGAGVRLGIICDVGIIGSEHLLHGLDRAGLSGCFRHWTFSDQVGSYKPSPVMFEHAMAGLGVDDPARMCHVGDLRRTDGARAAGWWSVRYAGLVDDPTEGPEADVVLHDHLDLPGLVPGLARP